MVKYFGKMLLYQIFWSVFMMLILWVGGLIGESSIFIFIVGGILSVLWQIWFLIFYEEENKVNEMRLFQRFKKKQKYESVIYMYFCYFISLVVFPIFNYWLVLRNHPMIFTAFTTIYMLIWFNNVKSNDKNVEGKNIWYFDKWEIGEKNESKN